MIDITDYRISVSKELKEHYNKIIHQRDSLIDSNAAEDKDIVAILSATTNILKEFSRLQKEVYNSENFAILTQVVIEVLKDYDPSIAQKVIDKYEERRRDLEELKDA